MKISIICIGIENPGNLGAIARSMKNFNAHELVLIDPQCDPTDEVARNRAKHAQGVLSTAVITDYTALERFDYLIGTTAALGTDYNIPRTPLTPRQFSQKYTQLTNSKVALVFGPEGTGLSNQDIRKMDFIVTIPTHKEYPVLNLSHAVSVLLYELFAENGTEQIGTQFEPCTKEYKDILLDTLSTTLDALPFATEDKRETQRIVWQRIIGKSFPSKREAFALIGYFKKVHESLGDTHDQKNKGDN